MVAGTSVVRLPVSDIDRSITFYRDQLGLNELQHQDNWAQLDANGLHIGLNAK
jgi:catechol 2,3-dioxygenase-like lactoylglutathione lyase family enzyme